MYVVVCFCIHSLSFVRIIHIQVYSYQSLIGKYVYEYCIYSQNIKFCCFPGMMVTFENDVVTNNTGLFFQYD